MSLFFLNCIFFVFLCSLASLISNCLSLVWWHSGKESACQCTRDAGSIPESGRSPGEGNGNHCSILAGKIPWTEEPGGKSQMRACEHVHARTHAHTRTHTHTHTHTHSLLFGIQAGPRRLKPFSTNKKRAFVPGGPHRALLGFSPLFPLTHFHLEKG